jgi:hypothetical protein
MAVSYAALCTPLYSQSFNNATWRKTALIESIKNGANFIWNQSDILKYSSSSVYACMLNGPSIDSI